MDYRMKKLQLIKIPIRDWNGQWITEPDTEAYSKLQLIKIPIRDWNHQKRTEKLWDYQIAINQNPY